MKKAQNISERILIGGRALVALGSSRSTNDTDYLVNDFDSSEAFIFDREANIDYCNANGNDFFNEIFRIEKGNQIASPQSLLELKSYSFVMHCKHMNWAKVADCEYDMSFLVREFDLEGVSIVKKYVSEGEFAEIEKEIKSVRK